MPKIIKAEFVTTPAKRSPVNGPFKNKEQTSEAKPTIATTEFKRLLTPLVIAPVSTSEDEAEGCSIKEVPTAASSELPLMTAVANMQEYMKTFAQAIDCHRTFRFHTDAFLATVLDLHAKLFTLTQRATECLPVSQIKVENVIQGILWRQLNGRSQ